MRVGSNREGLVGTSLLDTKRAEIVVGLFFIAIAAIVIRETIRLGAGWGVSGPQPGFFPLIAAALVAGVPAAVPDGDPTLAGLRSSSLQPPTSVANPTNPTINNDFIRASITFPACATRR